MRNQHNALLLLLEDKVTAPKRAWLQVAEFVSSSRKRTETEAVRLLGLFAGTNTDTTLLDAERCYGGNVCGPTVEGAGEPSEEPRDVLRGDEERTRAYLLRSAVRRVGRAAVLCRHRRRRRGGRLRRDRRLPSRDDGDEKEEVEKEGAEKESDEDARLLYRGVKKSLAAMLRLERGRRTYGWDGILEKDLDLLGTDAAVGTGGGGGSGTAVARGGKSTGPLFERRCRVAAARFANSPISKALKLDVFDAVWDALFAGLAGVRDDGPNANEETESVFNADAPETTADAESDDDDDAAVIYATRARVDPRPLAGTSCKLLAAAVIRLLDRPTVSRHHPAAAAAAFAAGIALPPDETSLEDLRDCAALHRFLAPRAAPMPAFAVDCTTRRGKTGEDTTHLLVPRRRAVDDGDDHREWLEPVGYSHGPSPHPTPQRIDDFLEVERACLERWGFPATDRPLYEKGIEALRSRTPSQWWRDFPISSSSSFSRQDPRRTDVVRRRCQDDLLPSAVRRGRRSWVCSTGSGRVDIDDDKQLLRDGNAAVVARAMADRPRTG